jgi:serine/threonine-protein kinase
MAGSPDFVKLLDFSVAKLLEGDRMKTQAGVVFGTPQYMSPEQGRGLPLDARSDLYALGVLAFEMLTGNVPFNDDNPMTVIQMHLHGAIPPMPDSVPYPVQNIVRRALEKDAARRYQSSGEMMQHCQQVFAELNSGNVSVGGGGVPRTMIAGPGQAPGFPGGFPPAQQQMPQQQPQMLPQQQGGYQAQTPQAKTMIAQQSPFANGQMPQMPQGMPGQAPGAAQSGLAAQQGNSFVPSSPMQKTIVAGMAPPIVGGQMQMPQGMQNMQNMQPQGTPAGFPQGMPNQGMGGMPGPPGGAPGPNKTVLLQPTDGIVSVAQHGAIPPSQMHQMPGQMPGPQMQRQMPGQAEGASTLFWVISLIVGVGVGVLAYVIVLHM